MMRRTLVLLTVLLAVVAAPAVVGAAPAPYGALTPLTGAGTCFSHAARTECPQVEMMFPKATVVSPDGRHLYTVGSTGVRGFARAADGRLTPLTGTGACIGDPALSACPVTLPQIGYAEDVVASGDGRFLYVGVRDAQAVVVLARDPDTGGVSALAGPGGCVGDTSSTSCTATQIPQLANPSGLALSADERFLYVSTFNSGSVVALARDAATGRLTPLTGPGWCVQQDGLSGCGKLEGAKRLRTVALAPDGRHLYSASRDADAIFGVDVDPETGRLTPMTGPGRCVQHGTGAPGTVCARTVPGLDDPMTVVTAGAGLVTSGAGSGTLRALQIAPDGGLLPGTCLRGLAGLTGCEEGLYTPDYSTFTPTPDGRSLLVAEGGMLTSVRTDAAVLAIHPSPARCVADPAYVPAACATALPHLLGGIRNVALSPDGTSAYVVTSNDSVLRVVGVEPAPVEPVVDPPATGAPPSSPPAGGNGKGVAGEDGGRAPTNRPAGRKATLTVAGRVVLGKRTTRLALACAAARCRGVVRVTAGRTLLARARVDLAAGQRKTVTVRLTRAGRRLVARRGGRVRPAVRFVPR